MPQTRAPNIRSLSQPIDPNFLSRIYLWRRGEVVFLAASHLDIQQTSVLKQKGVCEED